MTPPPDPTAADVAGKLTKASRRAILKIERDYWMEEGSPGPERADAYSLWWGRDYGYGLVEKPLAFAIGPCGCSWKWRLTRFGLAVKTYIQGTSDAS